MIRVLRASFAILMVPLAGLAGCGPASSNDHYQPVAAATCRSTAVYVSTFGNGQQSIDEFCGDRQSPTRRISLPSEHTAGALDHDDQGRLYVLTAYRETEAGPETGTLSIFDGQWHNVDLTKGVFGGIAVDRANVIVYVYHSVWKAEHASITAIDARGKILRTFPTEPRRPYGLLRLDYNDRLVIVPDFTGKLFVYDSRNGTLLHRAPAFGCAVTSGRDGTFYGLSCLGELAAYNPRSYKVVAARIYGQGKSFFGRETQSHPSIAVDKAGTLYLANQGDNTLSMYRSGQRAPFRVYAGLPVVDLQLDTSGNLYALVTTQELSRPQQINVYQHGTGVLLRTYTFARNEYPNTMTVVSSPAK